MLTQKCLAWPSPGLPYYPRVGSIDRARTFQASQGSKETRTRFQAGLWHLFLCPWISLSFSPASVSPSVKWDGAQFNSKRPPWLDTAEVKLHLTIATSPGPVWTCKGQVREEESRGSAIQSTH